MYSFTFFIFIIFNHKITFMFLFLIAKKIIKHNCNKLELKQNRTQHSIKLLQKLLTIYCLYKTAVTNYNDPEIIQNLPKNIVTSRIFFLNQRFLFFTATAVSRRRSSPVYFPKI